MSTVQPNPIIEAIQYAMSWFDREDDLPSWMPAGGSSGKYQSVPYNTESELDSIRSESRWFATYHPFAIAAIETRISYVVGAGHNYKVRPRPGVEIDPETLEKVNAEILAFQEQNNWFRRQQEIQRRMDRDGEVFLRLFEHDGKLIVRFIEPEYVRTPPPQRVAGQVDFGIEYTDQDVESVVAYWVSQGNSGLGSQEFERVPAEQIQHRKNNVDMTVPRGIPTLWGVRNSLRRAWKLLRNMSTVASIQAAIAIVRKHTGITGGSVQQYAAALATGLRKDQEGNVKTYTKYPAGTILDTPPGVEITFPAAGIDTSKYVECIQAELRAIASRLCLPEFMLSADASNANYSSTLVAEGPAVKMFERLQSDMIWHDSQIIVAALKVAERYGRLPAGIVDMVEIDAEAPTTMIRDRLKEAQADQILLTLGLVSPQTVAARYGYNYDQEKELMSQQEE